MSEGAVSTPVVVPTTIEKVESPSKTPIVTT